MHLHQPNATCQPSLSSHTHSLTPQLALHKYLEYLEPMVDPKADLRVPAVPLISIDSFHQRHVKALHAYSPSLSC